MITVRLHDWMSRLPQPRTLLWRTFLTIALLMVLSLAAWVQIYQHYAVAPRAQQVAQLLVSVVNLTRSALLASDATQRDALLRELSSLEGIRVYPAELDDQLEHVNEPLLLNAVRAQLGTHTRLARELSGLPGFYVSFRLDEAVPEDEYWVRLPAERVERGGAREWLGWGSAVVLLSLIGAWLLVLGVTRPLKALEQAARDVGRGHLPEPLPENGSREIAAVAQAFNQMSRDLTELESDRALILAGVSHDLRTPLARLRLSIEMSGASAEDLEAMSGDIEEMDRIISQFMDFARGAQAEPVSSFDLRELLDSIATPYLRRNRTLSLHGPESLPVQLRPQGLRRAITNLIDNALRYAGEESPIEIHFARQNGNLLQIDVSDRGPGIPPDQTERLKRPFTRLETARTDAKGSGLGLAIVERVARLHGGNLSLLSRAGGGLTARLQLSDASIIPRHETLS